MSGTAQWLVREDAAESVLVALYLRQVLGIRFPDELPQLRGVPPRASEPAQDDLDALRAPWRDYWNMTVEPLANPSPAPLDLVPGFGTLVALPGDAGALRAAIEPHASGAVAYAKEAHARYRAGTGGGSHRPYASAIAEHERRAGRPAHPFELNVQVLPLTQRGVWWIGSLTIAVTDGLRGDIAAFDSAVHPIIAELA